MSFLLRGLPDDLTQGIGQLVGARGVLVATTDALQLLDHITSRHAAHQRADALQITMATAHKLHIPDDALVIDVKIDLRRACALSIIGVTHLSSSLRIRNHLFIVIQ